MSPNLFAQVLDDAIRTRVSYLLARRRLPASPIDLIATDNLAEVIEKLVILHIRTWMLEDLAGECDDDAKLGEIKRKIDVCFKKKRPAFIAAINQMVDDAIVSNRSLREDSLKEYKEKGSS
jgi:hypothetical protein